MIEMMMMVMMMVMVMMMMMRYRMVRREGRANERKIESVEISID